MARCVIFHPLKFGERIDVIATTENRKALLGTFENVEILWVEQKETGSTSNDPTTAIQPKKVVIRATAQQATRINTLQKEAEFYLVDRPFYQGKPLSEVEKMQESETHLPVPVAETPKKQQEPRPPKWRAI